MQETITSQPPGRKRFVGGLGTLSASLLLAAGYFLYRAQPESRHSGEGKPLLELAARTLVPRVHILGGLKPSAAYAVETSKGLVLIDSGLDGGASPLKSELSELGLDWRGVRAILLTHAHGDHCGGARYLREMTGAKVYAGAGDAGVLKAGEPREAFFSTFAMPNDTPHPTTVDVELHGGESLAFGDVRFRVLAAPGHTPGSICYLMERGGLRVLFAGDVITKLHAPEEPRDEASKPLGTYTAYLAPRYRGNAKDYLNSLRQLRTIPVPDLVLPGHPAADPRPQSPSLSQRRWETLLDDGIREMATLATRYEADGADFLDGVPKPLLPDLYYLGDFGGEAVYGLFAATNFFLVDAPGGPGLGEFVKARLRQLGREPVGPTAVLLTSAGAEARAGLEEIVQKYHAQVFAPPAALETLKNACPDGTILRSAAELPSRGWFKVTPIPLRGRSVAPIAYQIEWSGKMVLFPGRIPIKITPQSVAGYASEIARSKADSQDYLESLEAIRDIKPDLWLPATPIDGQNANLYDNDWQRVINENRDIARFILTRTKRN
jgi:glyoxylase-like metal-dependent hydrolase (beta-lactamase superfamily II)